MGLFNRKNDSDEYIFETTDILIVFDTHKFIEADSILL